MMNDIILPKKMNSHDIFSIVSNQLDKNTQEDINGLYNLSQTSKEMNKIVRQYSNYDVLKKLTSFTNLRSAVCDNVNKAINSCTNEASSIHVEDATRIALENTKYIIPYLTNQDLLDINATICILYLDWDETCTPRKYRQRCLVEGKILYDFIKSVDNNYDFSLILPFHTNERDYIQIEESFNNWLNIL